MEQEQKDGLQKNQLDDEEEKKDYRTSGLFKEVVLTEEEEKGDMD